MFRKNTTHLEPSLFGIESHIESLPPERRKLRSNVEATVKEFTKPLNHKGNLKVRGLFKTMLYAYSMAIAINFGRVYRHMARRPEYYGALSLIRVFFFTVTGIFGGYTRNGLQKDGIRCKFALPGYSHSSFGYAV